MLGDWNLKLKQKFSIKTVIDYTVLAITCLLFLSFAEIKGIEHYDTTIFLIVVLFINIASLLITKNWLTGALKNSIETQSGSLTEATDDILKAVSMQKKAFNDLTSKTSEISNLISKLRVILQDSVSTSKSTEKQVNQSITFSQKEHDAISTNAEKMLVLRQKIQMVAELILELSEHSQQIGSTIGVVDDIAEQTNMLALNAAVEAARAGEHGKGFAVVAGEIRKLADESKQAITKITSLTSSIQYTTNSTVMATEEGSKEIEAAVKDINNISSNSEQLLNLTKQILESIDTITKNSIKQEEIIDQLNTIDDAMSVISLDLLKVLDENSEKISKLSKIAEIIKKSAKES